jgi:hypothetical protein
MISAENLLYLCLIVGILAVLAWNLLSQTVEVKTSMAPNGLTGAQVLVNGLPVVSGATYVDESGTLATQVRVRVPHGNSPGALAAREIARELAVTAMRSAVNAAVPGSLNRTAPTGKDYYSPLDIKL